MVTQKMVRTYEGKQVFSERKKLIRFVTAHFWIIIKYLFNLSFYEGVEIVQFWWSFFLSTKFRGTNVYLKKVILFWL